MTGSFQVGAAGLKDLPGIYAEMRSSIDWCLTPIFPGDISRCNENNIARQHKSGQCLRAALIPGV
jgi:hypothetical protein